MERKCQGCLENFNKDDLIKITKLPSGMVKINPKSNELGRSAYICNNKECIKKVIKNHRLLKALKCSKKEFERIEEELKIMLQKINL